MTAPAYVLVPGAGGAAWYWHRVAAELDARGVPQVTVGLPAADPAAGLPAYANLIVEAASAFDDVVLVGTSLNAFATSRAAAEVPHCSRLILLNAMVPAPGETAGEWGANTGAGDARRENDLREGRDPDAEFSDDVYYFHDLSTDLVADSLAHDSDETETALLDVWDLEAWPDVPTRVVISDGDRLFPAEFQRRVARERLGPDVEIVEVPGGHLAALSRPREVADALLLP